MVTDANRVLSDEPDIVCEIGLGIFVTAGALVVVISSSLVILALDARTVRRASLGQMFGNWLGGYYSDVLRRRDIRWSLWLVAAVFIGSKPFSMGFYLIDDTVLALALFAVPAAAGAIYHGPSIAALHDRIPVARRPIVSAIFLMLINFIGLGLGPLVTGAMSQLVFAGFGEHSLRYALVVMQIVGIWGGVHYWLAGSNLAAAKP